MKSRLHYNVGRHVETSPRAGMRKTERNRHVSQMVTLVDTGVKTE